MDGTTWTDAQGQAVESINSALPDDLYTILQVKSTESVKAIKKAYMKLALLCHPDKNCHPKASQAMQKLTNAYNILKDSKSRRKYNMVQKQRTNTTTSNDAPFTEPQVHTGTNFGRCIHKTVLGCHVVLWILFLISGSAVFLLRIPKYSLHRTPLHTQVHYTSIIGIQYFVSRAYTADTKHTFVTNYQVEQLFFSKIFKKCLAELKSNKIKKYNMSNTKNINMSFILESARHKMKSCIELLKVVTTISKEYIRLQKEHFIKENGVLHGGWDFSLPCSKEQSENYYLLRYSRPLNVEYYVDQEFNKDYKNKISMVDIKVEEIFLSEIVHACREEMTLRSLVGRSRIHATLVLKIVGNNFSKMTACIDLIELFPTLTYYYLETLEKEYQYQ